MINMAERSGGNSYYGETAEDLIEPLLNKSLSFYRLLLIKISF